jgi:hypothetical protein
MYTCPTLPRDGEGVLLGHDTKSWWFWWKMWKLIPKARARHRIVQHAPRNSSCCSCILPTFYGHIYQAAKPFLGFCIRYTVCGNLHWLAGHVSPDAVQSSSHFSAEISKQPAPKYPRLKTYYNNPFDTFDSTAIVSQSPPFSVDRCTCSGWSGFDDMEKMLMIHDDPFPNILNTVELFHYIHYIYHYSPLYITIIYYRYWLPLHITIMYLTVQVEDIWQHMTAPIPRVPARWVPSSATWPRRVKRSGPRSDGAESHWKGIYPLVN